jgi:GxxExxY protein
MQVHRVMGAGFLEMVYQEALVIEFRRRGIPHLREVPVAVHYGAVRLPVTYRADFVCFHEVLVELKAQRRLTHAEDRQVINYLKATGLECGLLLNFGSASLQYRRFIQTVKE